MGLALIGITVDNHENTRASGRYELGVGYSRAVAEAGGVPLLLAHELSRVEDYVALCDGLILSGGVDPDTAALPEHWPGHAPLHPAARRMDPTRQRFELALLAAVDRLRPDLPVLGICLGMQLMCLHHGGTLHQYLPETHPAEVVERHRLADHRVTIDAADSVLPAMTATVHSNHQQGVASAGRLRVVGAAEDRIIEAVDDPDRPFYAAVQWHPERTPGDAPLGAGLLTALLRQARK